MTYKKFILTPTVFYFALTQKRETFADKGRGTSTAPYYIHTTDKNLNVRGKFIFLKILFFFVNIRRK